MVEGAENHKIPQLLATHPMGHTYCQFKIKQKRMS